MPIWRLQCAMGGDTVFPRDKFVITPHFNDAGVGTDPQGLCDELADQLESYFMTPAFRQVEVTAYDAQGTVPVAPQGYAIRRPGSFPVSTSPREVACCLSFYSGMNQPRYRGRLYIPAYAIVTNTVVVGRPGTTVRDKVGALATILADLGGVDVDWSVFSRVMNEANPVSDWWVDDEWDTIRSRGLRATTRTVGTVSE